MIKQIKLEVAQLQDIVGILALQKLYLISNLSDKEKESGFVTTAFTRPQLTEIIEQEGLFIATDGNRIIAYLFAGSWNFFSQWPIFNYITAQFPELSFLDFDITTTHTFQYGPICLAKEYRSKGLINSFFEFMRIHMVKKYALSLTFINKVNIPSTKAHTEKLRWTIIADFEFNNNDYYILAYDMNQPVPATTSSYEFPG
jgi:hypothetical protein